MRSFVAMTERALVRERIVGGTAVINAFDAGRPVRALFVLTDAESDPDIAEACRRAEALGLPVRRAAEREMRRLSTDGVAPGVLALCGPPPDATLEAVLASGGIES